ncbi:MAG: lysine--tRNA ligase [Solirubrobacterales bacterium]|nr:lysine--tRNA ligase [Solirubrobacterales bacterium]MBV9680481.1 lysine--tRNA ligase [Solirubrobacterales bacterium]MBV9810657.1 lysine--tRNA ligase [Solirubrobacterales bacterium]
MSEEADGSAELLATRRRKLRSLREAGVEPFPHEFDGVEPIAAVRAAHESLRDGEETDVRHRLAGRLAARRGQGKMAFLDLVDRSGRIQLQARVDELGPEGMEQLLGLDLGDLIGVDGAAFRSKRGELTLRVESFTLLAKSLRPPPEKHHGLTDVETRFRRRELDLMANEEARELFIVRARVISAARRFLDAEGFIEVETPVLQPLYGGAAARPFTTHHNALNREFYLRIATELYLKRLIVGGLERVYELGKDFRNEGVDSTHNPEFTMLEFYEAYADYEDIAARCERLVAYVAAEAGYSGEIDLTPPWERETLPQAILDRTGIDIGEHADRDALAGAMAARGLNVPPKDTWPQLVDELLSKHVEPTLSEPTFLMDYPVALSPFAKRHRSNPDLVERFEAYVGGMEIANAFTELNDPDEQRRRFEEQRALAGAGDMEAQPFDEAFLEALEQGMPPTGGIGIGIDRLVMVITGRHSIREVVLFPAMRD